MVDVAALRQEYAAAGLDDADLAGDPVTQFLVWLDDAATALREPNAMVLSTAGAQGQPTARTVLLKAVDERGFGFFTNLRSRKARDVRANPQVALVFPWVDLGRQVTVVGRAEEVSAAEADAYFARRPRGAQLGAWASRQSEPLGSRDELEARMAEVERDFDGRDVPRPPQWGGLRVVPAEVEFWQGRPDRLHDRLAYLRDGGGWRVERRYP